jgi:hypothetical protein
MSFAVFRKRQLKALGALRGSQLRVIEMYRMSFAVIQERQPKVLTLRLRTPFSCMGVG